jgi:hypothetical protein
VFQAKVVLVMSRSNSSLAAACAERLAAAGFEIDQYQFPVVGQPHLDGAACVALLPDSSEAPAALQFLDKLNVKGRSPWMMICNLDPAAANARMHIVSTNSEDALFEAVVAGVRAWHGRLVESPYRVFLSYRRMDGAAAQAIHRFTGCWWDRAVLRHGVDWADEIEIGIRSCQLFAILLRGDIPSDSYVWRELDFATRQHKPTAVLAFGNEGEAVIARCGLNLQDFKRCTLCEPRVSGRDSNQGFRLLRSGTDSKPILYFPGLQEQLRWPRHSEAAFDYDTPAAVLLLSLLREYPDRKCYSTGKQFKVVDLLTPGWED